ncbi:MAG: D-amino-acid transaminase [Pseudomonadota bacterium]
MRQIAFLNGDYVKHADARISLFDRGFLFGDGVYDVIAVMGRKLVDFDSHFIRLVRSVVEIRIAYEIDRSAMLDIYRNLVEINDIVEGIIYFQITRGGTEGRDFLPDASIAPTIMAFCQSKNIVGAKIAAVGASVCTTPDQRWARRDIKSVNLLPSVLAKLEAQRSGADEIWMTDQDVITEGGSSSAFIVSNKTLITRANSQAILPGCTRAAVLALAGIAGIPLELRPFTLSDAHIADEAFFTSASNFVIPVVEIDKIPIGNRQPGPITRKLQELYLDFALRTSI